MFSAMSLEHFIEMAETHQNIAVYREISGDQLTTINAFLALEKHCKDITVLETSPKELHRGKHSHICFDAMATLYAFGHDVTIIDGQQTHTMNSDPFDVLRAYQAKYQCHTTGKKNGFVGGLVGFVSYDAVRLVENIKGTAIDHEQIPDVYFRFYRNHIVFDHQTGKVVISTYAHIGNDPKHAYAEATQRLDDILARLLEPMQAHVTDLKPMKLKQSDVTVDIDDETYLDMVEKAKKHIVDGDVFQVVLSRKFSVEINASPFDIYRALRFSNPSPYMFYLQTDDYVIAGASPEKLVSIEGELVETCPLAGTRPRGLLPDDALAQDLLSDAKEVAEHMMLVDLSRNDLGIVCQAGSIAVTKLKEIEKYTRVIHISSTVQGKLDSSKDAFDVLKATFPAGTLTGAPKIRAMQIIDHFEKTRRGIYGGVICGIDSQGDLESCIAIRTTVIRDGVASVRAGAGVVYDSDPQAEADETFHKARAILEGIIAVQGEVAK